MKSVTLTLLCLALLSVATTAPQFFRRRGTNAFGGVTGGARPHVTNVNAQVTNVNTNNPNTLGFSGGLALASSQQVSAFGSSIGISQAQAISQNIAIPVVPGFNRFANGRFG